MPTRHFNGRQRNYNNAKADKKYNRSFWLKSFRWTAFIILVLLQVHGYACTNGRIFAAGRCRYPA